MIRVVGVKDLFYPRWEISSKRILSKLHTLYTIGIYIPHTADLLRDIFACLSKVLIDSGKSCF